MTCRNCGREISEDATFCPHCGTRVVELEHTDFKERIKEFISSENGKQATIIGAISIFFLFIFIIAGVAGAGSSNTHSDTSAESTAQDDADDADDTPEMTKSQYCSLYLSISDVTVSHSGNYAYVRGTISNTGDSSVKYVKVKAYAYDSYKDIVDTDWTYAVDGTWFSPGENKQFEMMIRDENYRIKDANVYIIDD